MKEAVHLLKIIQIVLFIIYYKKKHKVKLIGI